MSEKQELGPKPWYGITDSQGRYVIVRTGTKEECEQWQKDFEAWLDSLPDVEEDDDVSEK
jgi:hypothetical protein